MAVQTRLGPVTAAQWRTKILPPLLDTLQKHRGYPADINALISQYALPRLYRYVHYELQDEEDQKLRISREDGYHATMRYDPGSWAIFDRDGQLHRLTLINENDGALLVIDRNFYVDFDWSWETIESVNLELLDPWEPIERITCCPTPSMHILFKRANVPIEEEWIKHDKTWECIDQQPVPRLLAGGANASLRLGQMTVPSKIDPKSRLRAVGAVGAAILFQPICYGGSPPTNFPGLVQASKTSSSDVRDYTPEVPWMPDDSGLSIPLGATVLSAGEFYL